ncbi:hypothetical protein ACFO1B_38885 [Dactylosporangium siamense]|uniref:Uncharacterized protein n=1 Tax=Dactylosporangium siamense TaxID=685454 RepID=A0A919PT30_9ACTN|nr:hypothetical protein [Dactylosporangium siamense]GIG50355.1 hypothetical protein Dsi01nite_083960 [Dactylosporangium siamense]
MTEHVAAALRAALTDEAAKAITAEDPWPRFAARETRHRRQRRIRRSAVAGLLLVAVGIQSNVVPLPGWMPGVAVAAAPSRLSAGPPRGGLAGDVAWQDGLRRQVKDMQDPEGWWRVGDRGTIRVVYAGDVPGMRLALVLVPLHFGVIRSWTLVWYAGPTGAAPEQMEQHSNTNADTPVATLLHGSADRGGVAVVVGPPGSTVTISGGATYSAAGTVDRKLLATSADGSGVAVAELPAGGPPRLATRITVDGAVSFEGGLDGGWSGRFGSGTDPSPEMLDAAARDARGPGLDRDRFLRFASTALNDSRLEVEDVTLRLLWTGTVNGQPAALLSVQPHGGGVIVYAMHGGVDWLRFDLRLLLPAAGAFERPIGWRLRAEGKDTQTDQVVVVAPPGAASVTVTAGGSSPAPVPLDASGAGTTTVPPGNPAVVTAYTSGGVTIASTPLHVLDTDMGQLPGDTPGTRVVG